MNGLKRDIERIRGELLSELDPVLRQATYGRRPGLGGLVDAARARIGAKRVAPTAAPAQSIPEVEARLRDLAARVSRLEREADRALLALADHLTRLDRRVRTGQLRARRARVEDAKRVGAALKRSHRFARLQQGSAQLERLRAAVSSAQVAAYGERGSPLAANNLLLAGNQLLWSMTDSFMRHLAPSPNGQPSPAAWLTPLASLATGEVLLRNAQEQRFVSGVASDFPRVTGRSVLATIELRPLVNARTWALLRGRVDVPVTTTMLDDSDGLRVLRAEVRNGLLTIEVSRQTSVPRPRVAWLIDTGEGNG